VKVLDLITFIKGRVNGVYYPNTFPISTKTVDDCATVKLTGGFPTDEWTGKKQPSFQVLVRGKVNGQADAETQAYAIFDALTNLRDVMIGDESVVVIRAMNSMPIFIGNDDNYRPIYSLNFNCVVRP
jgi:hypothetical protein